MEDKIKILVGIVTYNPDIKRLRQNLSAVFEQIDNVLIVDNGSINCREIAEASKNRAVLLCNGKNVGIAGALSKIMEYAKDKRYDWVLTLDQDSVIMPGLIDVYAAVSNQSQYRDVGMLTCLIKDRNFKDKKYEYQNKEVIEVPYCITSATFTNVSKYFETDGYDKDFFIDAVDFDICYSLREMGYRICRINKLGLYHEVGHGENRRFLWKEIVVYHQNPLRVYYLARNTVKMHKKHKKLFPWYVMLKKEMALFFRITIYENQRVELAQHFFKGLRDAKR